MFASGIALAVCARVRLGRNWGMPMTQKAEPGLVTSGSYRFVRNPIYSGLLAVVLGTALVTNLIGLIIAAILGAYFSYKQHCPRVVTVEVGRPADRRFAARWRSSARVVFVPVA